MGLFFPFYTKYARNMTEILEMKFNRKNRQLSVLVENINKVQRHFKYFSYFAIKKNAISWLQLKVNFKDYLTWLCS